MKSKYFNFIDAFKIIDKEIKGEVSNEDFMNTLKTLGFDVNVNVFN